jgi:hypothetical protein
MHMITRRCTSQEREVMSWRHQAEGFNAAVLKVGYHETSEAWNAGSAFWFQPFCLTLNSWFRQARLAVGAFENISLGLSTLSQDLLSHKTIMMSVVLHERETWSLTLREGHTGC